MRQLVKFDPLQIKEQGNEIVLPAQVPVILDYDWDKQIGVVDLFINVESKEVYTHFNIYDRHGVTNVTNFNVKPIVKTTYHSLKQITITGFSLNKKS